MNGELEALISAGTCKCADVQAVKNTVLKYFEGRS
jgi:hypothetical protein